MDSLNINKPYLSIQQLSLVFYLLPFIVLRKYSCTVLRHTFNPVLSSAMHVFGLKQQHETNIKIARGKYRR
jgi:hypothetical protein